MPVVQTHPASLKPYIFHGITLSYAPGSKHATGDCPFCGREGKFQVVVENELYRCLICNTGTVKGGGNHEVFVRQLHDKSLQRSSVDYAELADNRGLMDPTSLRHWGIASSISDNQWLIPGYRTDGRLASLAKFVYIPSEGKRRVRWTPEMGIHLFGIPLWDSNKPTVYLTEGVWKAIGLWEVLRQVKETGNGLLPTASESSSMFATANVLGVPGCGTFQESWCPLLRDKNVIILFDNDYPGTNDKTGETIPPAAWSGTLRTVKMLMGHPTPPASIQFLKWGPEGYDPSLPKSTGIDNLFKQAGTHLADRIPVLKSILGKIVTPPDEWTKGIATTSEGAQSGDKTLLCVPCDNYASLTNSWKKAMKWTEGLDHALVSCLTAVASVPAIGDQLWLKLIGPASCGKTTIAEACCVARAYTVARSTVRGFNTGFKFVGPDGQEVDISLIEAIRNKALFTKDGDTLLQSPNVGQILAEGRDLYDGVTRSQYRNSPGKEYTNHRTSWILCGTSSLRALDTSELGERFLDCVLMDAIDDELEDEVLWRVVNKSDRNVSCRSDGDAASQYSPEMKQAYELTGGYVNHLFENAAVLAESIESPEWAMRLATRFGKFTAFMRARPSETQMEDQQREFAARLVSVLWRYAKFCAVVLNKTSVDEDVMRRVRRMAMDTSRGVTLRLSDYLYANQSKGMDTKALALYTNQTEQDTRKLLKFMRAIGAVELFSPEVSPDGPKMIPRWRLSQTFLALYRVTVKQSVEDSRDA